MKNPFMTCMRQNSTANDVVQDWTYESFITQENQCPKMHEDELAKAPFCGTSYSPGWECKNASLVQSNDWRDTMAPLCDQSFSAGLVNKNVPQLPRKESRETKLPLCDHLRSAGIVCKNGPPVRSKDWRDRETEKTQIHAALMEFMGRRGVEWQQQALMTRDNPDFNNARPKERPVVRSASRSRAPFSLTDINKLYAQKKDNIHR